MREEDVLTVTDWTAPTPLPFAPSSVLGVVSVHGRMFTVVDLEALMDSDGTNGENHRCILALRGDEQLALAANKADQVLETNVGVGDTQENQHLIRGTINVDGKTISILDVENLFAGVIRGRERRQRRF